MKRSASKAPRRLAFVFVSPLVLISGCSLSKPPSHSQIVSDALPKGTTIPPAWATPANTNNVSTDWLKSFNDPTLDQLVAESLANNLNLRQAAAQVEIARQVVVVAGSQLKPQVGVNLGVASTRDEHHDQWYQASLVLAGAAWEPDVWGRLRAQRAATEAKFEATELDFAFARQSLAAATATSWYSTIQARELLSIAEQTVQIYTQLLDLVKIRRRAGKVTDLDVAEVGGNLNTAQSELREAEGVYDEARRNLEVLLGRYPAAELTAAKGFPAVPPPIQAGLPSSLLARRPDIVAAERQVLAAFRAREAAKLALWPSFSLNLVGGHLSDNLLSVLHVNPWMVHASLGMAVPIYTGGALQAKIKIATAQQQEAVASYGSVALTAFREVENGLTNEELIAQRLHFEQAALRDSNESVRIARIRYTAGSMDMLSVLQLEVENNRIQVDVVSLRNAQLANRINLHLALGGSFDAIPVTAQLAAPAR
jgi:outer membrane protein, multidrug efflux system